MPHYSYTQNLEGIIWTGSNVTELINYMGPEIAVMPLYDGGGHVVLCRLPQKDDPDHLPKRIPCFCVPGNSLLTKNDSNCPAIIWGPEGVAMFAPKLLP